MEAADSPDSDASSEHSATVEVPMKHRRIFSRDAADLALVGGDEETKESGAAAGSSNG